MNKYMSKAKELAHIGSSNEEGGPFGAVIVDKNGQIVSEGNNRVLISNDPTAHAEIIAIRNACSKLKTTNLEDYTLYTSCEPCPMCLSAIIWANIKNVYYGCTRKDASKIGFRDDDIYEHIKGNNKMLNLIQLDREECLKTMEEYEKNNGVIY